MKSFDAPNTQSPNSRHRALKQIVNDWWILEISASILSFVFLGAVFALYKKYDGTGLEDYPHTWGLQSIIGFLVTIIHFAIVYQLAAAIGQLKWQGYDGERSLEDIDIFDQASRGPVGSVKLLFRTKFRQVNHTSSKQFTDEILQIPSITRRIPYSYNAAPLYLNTSCRHVQ